MECNFQTEASWVNRCLAAVKNTLKNTLGVLNHEDSSPRGSEAGLGQARRRKHRDPHLNFNGKLQREYTVFRMGRSFLVCWLLILMVAIFCDPSLARSRPGSGRSRQPKKYKNTGQKTVVVYNTWAFIQGNTKLKIDFNDTEEASYYQSNYTQFPNEVFYPENPESAVSNETEEAFVQRCFNGTVMQNKPDVFEEGHKDLSLAGRVMVRIINYLCLKIYFKNGAAATTSLTPLLLSMLLLSFAVK
ncbi:prion-like protein doppel [Microcaecilia unicolor]|uniref:Prion-like protein doppel n=1 Tax=Microcaecilia unicolor TaxID=1415580 RepID=A0A6P7XSG7_9AMPH|nr:prion-like protein doppel [Microcaecilia unicolor]